MLTRLDSVLVVLSAMLWATSGVAAAWPTAAGPSTWPAVEAGRFRYVVQPAKGDQQLPSAQEFRTEFGPVFESAETLANQILATTIRGRSK